MRIPLNILSWLASFAIASLLGGTFFNLMAYIYGDGFFLNFAPQIAEELYPGRSISHGVDWSIDLFIEDSLWWSSIVGRYTFLPVLIWSGLVEALGYRMPVWLYALLGGLTAWTAVYLIDLHVLIPEVIAGNKPVSAIRQERGLVSSFALAIDNVRNALFASGVVHGLTLYGVRRYVLRVI